MEEQKFAEVTNALAAMEWADQTNQHDALLSLFVGGILYWKGTGGLARSWLGRIPEPPASEPSLRSEWLATCGVIRIGTGDEATGYAQLFEAAALADELVTADPTVIDPSSLAAAGLVADATTADDEGRVAATQ